MKLKFLFLIALLSGSAYAKITPDNYDFRALYNYAKVDGFVQIPKGGQYGTTTLNRPTFNEMGIKKIKFPEFQVQANWEKFSVYGNFKYTTFKGSATLEEDLITHSRVLPKGTHFKTSHKYVSYTLGAKYNLYANDFIKVKPLIEYSVYDFSYKYDGNIPNKENISGERSFRWGQANVGFDIINPITEKYSIETTFKYGIRNDKIREFYSLNLLNKYNVFANDNHNLNLLFGVGYGKLRFKDKQKDSQNHIVQKIKPNFTLGLEYSF